MTEKVWRTPRTWPSFDATTDDEEEAQRWRDAGYQVYEYVKVEPAAAGDDGGTASAVALAYEIARGQTERLRRVRKSASQALPAPQPSRAASAEDMERVADIPEISLATHEMIQSLKQHYNVTKTTDVLRHVLAEAKEASEKAKERARKGLRGRSDLLELRTLIGYAIWQVDEGSSHHPTLPSAIASAQAALARISDKLDALESTVAATPGRRREHLLEAAEIAKNTKALNPAWQSGCEMAASAIRAAADAAPGDTGQEGTR